MAKIFPEQLGYLTLPAPSRFPNASKALSRWGGGEEKLPTRTRPAGAASPHAALPPRAGPGLPAHGEADSGAAPPRPPLPARHHTPTALPGRPPARAAPPSGSKAAGSRRPLKAGRGEAAEAPKLEAARRGDVPLKPGSETGAAPRVGSHSRGGVGRGGGGGCGGQRPAGRQRPGGTPPALLTGKGETAASRRPLGPPHGRGSSCLSLRRRGVSPPHRPPSPGAGGDRRPAAPRRGETGCGGQQRPGTTSAAETPR